MSLKPNPENIPEMTGEDLIEQENYEENVDRQIFNNYDRVDRRDKRGEIVSFVANSRFRNGYDRIDWNKK